jgi:hypothetical protein
MDLPNAIETILAGANRLEEFGDPRAQRVREALREDPAIGLRFVGRHLSGGYLNLIVKGVNCPVAPLSIGAFAVLAALDDCRASNGGSAALSFLTMSQLDHYLRRHHGVASDHHEKVYKYVAEARFAIRRSAVKGGPHPTLEGREVGTWLLENDTRLGYRLGIDDVECVVLDDALDVVSLGRPA